MVWEGASQAIASLRVLGLPTGSLFGGGFL